MSTTKFTTNRSRPKGRGFDPIILMKSITSKEFKKQIDLDPAWASKLTEPVEITDYCNMVGSEITHLSGLLHFTGEDHLGNCADFSRCASLEIAEGNFSGYVSFHASKIQKISNLNCGEDRTGNSASFSGCQSLKIAEGNFSGCVSFFWSGIEKIGNLHCGRDADGNSTIFPEGDSPGIADFPNSTIKRKEILNYDQNSRGVCLNIRECENLARIPTSFHPGEIDGDPQLIQKLKADRLKRSVKTHIQTGIVEI